jgi:hypothetical protein
MGRLIGDYLYAKRHNRVLDGKRSAAKRIPSRVRIGVALR